MTAFFLLEIRPFVVFLQIFRDFFRCSSIFARFRGMSSDFVDFRQISSHFVGFRKFSSDFADFRPISKISSISERFRCFFERFSGKSRSTRHTRATHESLTSHSRVTHKPLTSHLHARHKRHKITHQPWEKCQTHHFGPFQTQPTHTPTYNTQHTPKQWKGQQKNQGW